MKLTLLLLAAKALCFVHPITTKSRFFVDSVTGEPFYIKGVDYQPGGSAAFTGDLDPLSDPTKCARDITLFQDLGINTIRVYSINTELNHDVCMSLLALAGIYLVLDVNSPLLQHHLNRYEPWTSYTEEYLNNVFKVAEQFAHYNNTLGFFAGNEIINDDRSARLSPVFVKAVVRDLKQYLDIHAPRNVPVGYSAADDLRYRMPVAEYLECEDESMYDLVDFYGVNSYQWCGEQTFYTSGYNVLLESYLDYNRPVFLSEFGCNEVTPRAFDEIKSIYSSDMTDVFSGGLVYEFTQEPNQYGLVEILPNGDVQLLKDFLQLKYQYLALSELDYTGVLQRILKGEKESKSRFKGRLNEVPQCALQYDNIDILAGLPETPALYLLDHGVQVQRGKYVEISPEQSTNQYKVLMPNGSPYTMPTQVEPVVDILSGGEPRKMPKVMSGMKNGTYSDESEWEYVYDSEESDQEDILDKVSGFFLRIFNKVLGSLGY